jgi:lysine/ornithine N-monooxygenase
MQSNTLVIIGGGPRGLACAIEMKDLFTIIYVIDETPTNSWSPLSTLANFELRSPVSFDLVTYSSTNKDYSLSEFLYNNNNIQFTNQRELEEDSRRLKRLQFYQYICWAKDKLQQSNVQFIYNNVKNIYNNTITLNNEGKIKFDYLILAQGTKEKPQATNLLRYKNITNSDVLNNEYKSVLIIGSGQAAYDIASHLHNKDVRVGLYIKNRPKINQYPAPSYSIWKERSAIGSYCASLVSQDSRTRYIKTVKAWAPSITPNNEYLLTTIPIYENNNIDEVIKLYDNKYINRTGVLPVNTLNINSNQVTSTFRINNSNMFVTGPLSILIDGPRVNSVISSSSTAITIRQEIERNASI